MEVEILTASPFRFANVIYGARLALFPYYSAPSFRSHCNGRDSERSYNRKTIVGIRSWSRRLVIVLLVPYGEVAKLNLSAQNLPLFEQVTFSGEKNLTGVFVFL